MVRRFSVGSTVGLAAILGIGGCTLLLAQEPAAGRAGANAPRPTPAVLVMKAEFKAAVAGKTEQLPFVQANVVDPNLELKQYGAGKDVLTNAGNPAQFIPFSAWTGMTAGPFALTFRDKTNLLDLSGGARSAGPRRRPASTAYGPSSSSRTAACLSATSVQRMSR